MSVSIYQCLFAAILRRHVIWYRFKSEGCTVCYHHHHHHRRRRHRRSYWRYMCNMNMCKIAIIIDRINVSVNKIIGLCFSFSLTHSTTQHRTHTHNHSPHGASFRIRMASEWPGHTETEINIRSSNLAIDIQCLGMDNWIVIFLDVHRMQNHRATWFIRNYSVLMSDTAHNSRRTNECSFPGFFSAPENIKIPFMSLFSSLFRCAVALWQRHLQQQHHWTANVIHVSEWRVDCCSRLEYECSHSE